MSTRSTVWYDPDSQWHLYREALDNKNVYLEFPMPDGYLVDAYGNGYGITPALRIPLHVFKHIVQAGEDMSILRFVDMPEDQLRIEAEATVDAHRQWLKDHADSPLAKAAGMLTFGPPETPREEMVEKWMDCVRYTREDVR